MQSARHLGLNGEQNDAYARASASYFDFDEVLMASLSQPQPVHGSPMKTLTQSLSTRHCFE